MIFLMFLNIERVKWMTEKGKKNSLCFSNSGFKMITSHHTAAYSLILVAWGF